MDYAEWRQLDFEKTEMRTSAIHALLRLSLIGLCTACADPMRPDPRYPTAEKIRGDALAAAKKEGKSALLVFSMQGDVWCESLDRFHADPEVQAVLSKHFVLGRVDILETPGGRHMLEEHGFAGTVPALSVLDFKGMLLANSGDGEQNFGFPNNDEQVERYVAAIKTACPQMADDEIAVLRNKLEQMRQPE
jgi:hypothetical protein